MPTDHSLLDRARAELHGHVAPRRHSALLAAIVLAFAVRPLIGDTVASFALFSIAELLLLVVALYSVNLEALWGEGERLLSQSRLRLHLGWGLAAVAAVERVFNIFLHSSELQLVGSIFWLLFIVFVTASLLQSVLKQREITGETISMAISIYLLLGFAWALLYAVIFQLHPDSFGGLAVAQPGHPVEIQHLFPILGYFSLTTLSTIGFGDITPLTLQARYAAVAEGITGQFYLAILVARLVGLQMSQSASQHTEQ